MPAYPAKGTSVGTGGGGSTVNQTIMADIHAEADMEIVANDGNGLRLRFGDPVTRSVVPPVLAASVISVDTDLDNGDIPGPSVRWHVPMQGNSNPAHDATDSVAFYRTDQHRLRYSDGARYVNAANIPEGENFFDPDITWANVGATNAEIFADGTGRFDTNADVLAYVSANHDVFQARFEAGRTRIAYYSTVQFRVNIADITSIGTPLVPAGSPYVANGEAGNDWTLQGRKRDVGEAATGATWRLITVADGSQGIEVTLTNPLGLAGNAYDVSYIVADLNPNRVTEGGTRILFYPGDNWLASAILTALNALTNYSAAYYGAEDGTSEPFDDLTTGQIFIGGFPLFSGGVDPVPGTAPDVVVDETANTIRVNYAPAAEGSVTTPDTLGTLKALLDVEGIRGVFNEYLGTGIAADDFTRATPWDEPFGGGSIFNVDATGWGPGPPQNVFTGADEAAAVAVLLAYSAANDAWRATYLSDQRLTVALRWGSDGDGTTYYLDTDGTWKDLGLVWLQGPPGGIGPPGPTSDLEFDSTIDGSGTTADPRRVAFPYTAVERSYLAGIESEATQDQTNAEIKTAYEANPDTNAFTDALQTKVDSVETDSKDDQTDAEIKTAYETNADTNAFTDALLAKVDSVETDSKDDQTGAEIVALLQALTGNGRLNATALRMLADALDAELGSAAWRTGGVGVPGSADTAAQILAKLLTVDGSGSDLDADLLDGLTPEEVAATGHRGSPLPTYLLTGATWDAANHTIEGTVAGITGLQTTDELILVLPAAMPGRGTSFTNLSVNGESRLPLRPLVDGSGFVPSQELVPGEILLLFRSGSLGYRLLEPHILERAGVWNAGRIYLRGQDVLRGDYDYKLLAETSSNERPEDHPEIWLRFPHITDASGTGSSDIRILAPDADPDRENWEEGAAQWTGEALVPIVRELADGHGAVVRFATIDPATGMEIMEVTPDLATMQDSANLNTTVAWLWATGQDVRAGDLSYRMLGGTTTYYRCIRTHTSVPNNVANGPPNTPAQTGWEIHTPVSIANSINYRGVFRSTREVPEPLATGQWVVTTAAGYAYLERYTAGPPARWLQYIIPSVVMFGQISSNNEEAYGHIQSFNSSEPQYLLIGGFLKVLTWYTAPAAGHESFHARAVYRSNARAYFWLKDQDEQAPDGSIFPAAVPISTAGVAFLEFKSENPDRAYDNGDVIYARGTSLSVDSNRMLLIPPRGRHDIHIVLESSYNETNLLIFSLYKDTDGLDDRYLGQAKVPVTAAVRDITLAVRFLVPDVVADGSEHFYIRVDGLTGPDPLNLRGFVSFEYKGDE